MEIPVKVSGIVVDPISNMPIVVLKDELRNRVLPIWIGIFEANAIAIELEKVKTPRPMTHDLLRNVISTLGAKVEKVVVNDLRDNTFYAVIHLTRDGEKLEIDSRPSDAIALAVRVKAPIFVEDHVFEKATVIESTDEDLSDPEKLKEWLENLNPEDFGKYKM